MRIVIGMDGGQSSTLALAAGLDGVIVGSGLAGPSNHIDEPGGRERLKNAVTGAVRQALGAAQAQTEEVTHVCLGMTGAPDEARAAAMRLLPMAVIEAHHDWVTALAGASLARPGVVVIAGTGAVAYGRLADGREARAGGWGYLMGDEGSAYDLGIAALRLAAQASDGRADATQLTWRVPRHFHLTDLMEVRRAVYSPAVTRPDIAGLAAVVTEAARAGDLGALRLLESAGRALAEGAAAVIARLGQRESGMSVYHTGGVFRAGDLILNPLRAALEQHSPASQVLAPAFSPAVGAVLLALRAAGVELSAALIENIKRTLPAQALIKQQGTDDAALL